MKKLIATLLVLTAVLTLFAAGAKEEKSVKEINEAFNKKEA